MGVYIGIDGGGSNLRVAVMDDTLSILSESRHSTVNPNIIGHEEASQRIQTTILDALAKADINVGDIAGVGIGIAGAHVQHSEAWLRQTIADILPDTFLVPSSDTEIALVGASGKREGIIIVAGTGSILFGINDAGESAQVGGWGYLLDDEGSGYWIGKQAIKHLASVTDIHIGHTQLSRAVMKELAFDNPRDVVGWLYQTDSPPPPRVAQLAPLVLSFAETMQLDAHRIVEMAVANLVMMTNRLIKRLKMNSPAIYFTGGLISQPNVMSLRLCKRLGLDGIPQPKYPPVVGAGLLAKLMKDNHAD